MSEPDEIEWWRTTMAEGALSKVGLERMHGVLAGHVERGNVPGLVTLVSRRDEVRVEALGTIGSACCTRSIAFPVIPTNEDLMHPCWVA
jgi:hypothetical protein